MGRTASLVTFALLLVACGGRSSEGDAAGGTSGSSAGSPSPASAGRTAVGVEGSSGTTSGAGGGNANAAGAPHTPRLEYCEGSSYWCCDRDDGHEFPSTCGPDDRWLPCEGNSFHPSGEPVCSPESLPVADCQELEGFVCRPGDECHNLRACSTFCTCEDMGGSTYLWKCLEYAC